MKKRKITQILFSMLLGVAVLGVKTDAAELDVENNIRKTIMCRSDAMLAAEEELELIDAGYLGNSGVVWGFTSDGILMITGEGTMPNYPYSNTPWVEFREDIRTAVISGTVKNIGENTFHDCDNLEVVVIENGVTKIGERAFADCDKVKSLNIPNSVTSIGEYAFSGCDNLQEIKLSDKLKNIEEGTFSGSGFKTFTVPNGVTTIGMKAFYGCSDLTSVKIPNTVTRIGESAFLYCTSLETFSFPNSIKMIENELFLGCTKLKSVNISSSITTIGYGAFKECTSLEKIYIPDSVLSMQNEIFMKCTNLKEVRLSNNLIVISDSTFEDCKKLKSISIPGRVEKIGKSAFMGCYSLTDCDISSSVRNIGWMAFSSCDNLETIRIPANVKVIENFAFQHCNKLNKISILNPNTTLEENIFNNTPNILVRCLENSTAYDYALKNGHPYELIDLNLVEEYFSDIYTDWYTEYVQYVYNNKLMTGIKGTDRFEPNANITKAQVAMVLYNIEGQPKVTKKDVFAVLTDVYEAEWYGNAVAWAYNAEIVTGDTNEMKFFPDADVTREELALMMYRYACYKEYDVTEIYELENLEHAENVSNWATDGVRWAVGSGLISGIDKNGTKDLAPQGNATRAQMAAILQRFCEKFNENSSKI